MIKKREDFAKMFNNISVVAYSQWLTMFVCLFELRFNVPVKKKSVMSGRSHCFIGFNQYSMEFMSCSRTQQW